MNPHEISFAADGMLQSLAKWLRLLGYDCIAGSNLFGRALVEKAVAENRWMITRNRHFTGDLPHWLIERADIFVIASEQLPEQLRETLERFSLEPDAYCFTRCLICNEPLIPVAKPQLSPNVPQALLQREDRFWKCDHCGRIFWRGSHVHASIRRLKDWLNPASDDPL